MNTSTVYNPPCYTRTSPLPVEKPKLRIVTMCQGGHVRSVGLKYLLRYSFGHDVIACGWEGNTEEAREMLFKWADYIVVMQSEFAKYVPEKHHNRPDKSRKLFAYDVGEDRYGNPFHPELQRMLEGMVRKHGLFVR